MCVCTCVYPKHLYVILQSSSFKEAEHVIYMREKVCNFGKEASCKEVAW
jgi:hypothetical protein